MFIDTPNELIIPSKKSQAFPDYGVIHKNARTKKLKRLLLPGILFRYDTKLR